MAKAATTVVLDLTKPLVWRRWDEELALRRARLELAEKIRVLRRLERADGIAPGPFRDATRIAAMPVQAAQEHVMELIRMLKDLGILAHDSPDPAFVQGRLL